MELRLSLQLNQYTNIEDVLRNRPQITTQIEDEVVKYFPSNSAELRRLGSYDTDSNLGYFEKSGSDGEDDYIVVNSKKLNPAQMPFVALYLKFTNMCQEEKQNFFGSEGFVSKDNLDRVILDTTLEVAKEYLRPKDFASLAKLFLDSSSVLDENKSFVALALQDVNHEGTTALVNRQDEVTNFYFESNSGFLVNYRKNKFVKGSEAVASLPENLSGMVVPIYAHKVYVNLKRSDYSGQIDNLLEFVSDLREKFDEGSDLTIDIDSDASGFIYFISNVVGDTYRGTNFITFDDEYSLANLKAGENRVTISKAGFTFFSSLEKVLACDVKAKYDAEVSNLKALEYVCTQIGSDDKNLKDRFNVDITALALVGDSCDDGIVDEQAARVKHRQGQVSMPDNNDRALKAAKKALDALTELEQVTGESVEDLNHGVRRRIKPAVNNTRKRVRSLIGRIGSN
jgi:hypothetical protein